MNSRDNSWKHTSAVVAIYAAAALFLCGCATNPLSVVMHPGSWFSSTKTATVQVLPAAPDTAAVRVNQQLSDLETKASIAAQALKTTQTENLSMLSKLKANVGEAVTANGANPEGAPKTIVAGELGVASSRLDGVPTDPIEAAAATNRALLVEQGRSQEARAAYTAAMSDGKQQAAELAKAREQATEAYAAENSAESTLKATVEAYEERIKANGEENTAKLERVESAIQSDQVRNLNIAGGLCVVLLGLGVGFGGLAGLRMTYPFGIMAAVLFGLAQVVGSVWFHYAIAVGLVIAVLGVAYYLYQRFLEGKTHAQVVAANAQLTGVLHNVIPVLDKAYDGATAEVKQVLDDRVFTPLATSMDRSEKAAVEGIRTSIAATAPVAAVAAATPSKPTA